MNDETALQIIEDYFARKASRADYEAALNYFATAPASRSRLVKLYKALVEPGGISCENCQDEMLRYSDPVSRPEMSATEREQFLLHVSQCVNCAEQYLELASFEQGLEQTPDSLKIPRFKVPKPAVTDLAEKRTWHDSLEAILEKVVNTAGRLKLNVQFDLMPVKQVASGVIRETPAPYAGTSADFSMVARPDRDEVVIEQKERVPFSSVNAKTCEIQITVQKPDTTQPPSNYLVRLSYREHTREKTTNEKGQAIFEAIPVASLPDLRLEITLNG